MTWEYAHRYFHHPFPGEDLEAMGKQGWELVAISRQDALGNSFFYFKRPATGLAATLTSEKSEVHFAGEILPPTTKPKKKKS